MSKKIAIGLFFVALVVSIGAGTTVALFSDTEQSENNTFTAGELDLKVGSSCSYNGQSQQSCSWIQKDLQDDIFFNFQDIKPGDSGENTISLKVIDNPAWVCAKFSNISSQENGCTEPESKLDQSCEDPGVGDGELLNNLFFTMWKDTNCDNILDPNEVILLKNQPAPDGVIPIADSSMGNPIPGDTRVCYGISWQVPTSTGNIIQSDSITGDIEFSAIQSRNLNDYRCTTSSQENEQPRAALNPDNGHYYEVVDVVTAGENCIIWSEANEAASTSFYEGLRGHLATVTSQAENDWLIQNIDSLDKWLGGFQDVNDQNYSEPSGGWKWITGEAWNYTNWLSGEPNNFGGDERHLGYYFSDKWNDKSSCARGYIIEYEPASSSSQEKLLFLEDFEDTSRFTLGGGYDHAWIYWGIAPLSGTTSIPSNFVQGGSQAGNIFYGSFGKGHSTDPSPTMTIALPDLTGYTNLKLTVALAAPENIWESSHRDSLYISGSTGPIDSFLPPARPSSLRSQTHSTDLVLEFKDFDYSMNNNLDSLVFTFGSTAYEEIIGIDSVKITGIPTAP